MTQRPTAKPSPLHRHREEQEARLARSEGNKWQTLAGLCERVDALDAGFKTLTDGDSRRTLAGLCGRVDALDAGLKTLAEGDGRRTLAGLCERLDALDAGFKTLTEGDSRRALADGDTRRTLAFLGERMDALDANLAARPAGQAGSPDQATSSLPSARALGTLQDNALYEPCGQADAAAWAELAVVQGQHNTAIRCALPLPMDPRSKDGRGLVAAAGRMPGEQLQVLSCPIAAQPACDSGACPAASPGSLWSLRGLKLSHRTRPLPAQRARGGRGEPRRTRRASAAARQPAGPRRRAPARAGRGLPGRAGRQPRRSRRAGGAGGRCAGERRAAGRAGGRTLALRGSDRHRSAPRRGRRGACGSRTGARARAPRCGSRRGGRRRGRPVGGPRARPGAERCGGPDG